MPRSYLRNRFLCAVIGLTNFIHLPLVAQTSTTLEPLPGHSGAGMSGAESRWQLSAVDIQAQSDPVAPVIRAARNAFWQPILAGRRQMEAGGHTAIAVDGLPPITEVSRDPETIWVVATFESSLVLSIDSGLTLLYTEMHFRVLHTVHQPAALSLTQGSTFDVDIPGGVIKTPSGTIESWQVRPRRFFVQPGHTYIMSLKAQPTGNLFYLIKQWDVSTGKVVPDTDTEVSRAADGKSILTGMNTADAIAYIKSILPQAGR